MPPEQQPQYQYQQQPEQPVQYSYEQPKTGLPMFKILLVVFVFFVLALFQFAWNHGFVEVTVESASDDEITYTLAESSEVEPEENKSSVKTFRKLVSKGEYELLVRQAGGNYIANVETKGLFGTTKVTAKVAPERGRQFAGNQPLSCMHKLSSAMVSYPCGGTLGEFVTHKPATANQPTVAQKNVLPSDDVVQGLIDTKEGTVLLLYEATVAGHEQFERQDEQHSPHIAFLLKNGLNTPFEDRTLMTDLPQDRTISIVPFRDGFLAYDNVFEKAFYYTSIKSRGEPVTIPKPEGDRFHPYDLTAKDQLFAVAFNESGRNTDPDENSLVLVQEGNETREYEFSRSFDKMRICGTEKLCATSEQILYVYDVSGGGAKLELTMPNVVSLENYQGGLAIIRSDGVISFDVDKREGNMQYSFGNKVDYCGFQPVDDSYALCISYGIDGHKQTSILMIDQNQESDDIDKKIIELLNKREVIAVSVFKNRIFISPDGGGLDFRPSLGRFDYDPEVVKKAKQVVEETINETGIDRSKYTINVTL